MFSFFKLKRLANYYRLSKLIDDNDYETASQEFNRYFPILNLSVTNYLKIFNRLALSYNNCSNFCIKRKNRFFILLLKFFKKIVLLRSISFDDYVSKGDKFFVRKSIINKYVYKFSKNSFFYDNDIYLYLLKNININPTSSLFFNDKKKLCITELLNMKLGKYINLENDPYLISRDSKHIFLHKNKYSLTIEEGFLLSGYGSNQYGHWFAESLPKMFAYKHIANKKIPVLIRSDLPVNFFSIFKILNDNIKVIKLNPNISYEVKNLYLCNSSTHFPPNLYNNYNNEFKNHELSGISFNDLTFLRKSFLRSKFYLNRCKNFKSNKKYFLTRQSSLWRNIVNEDILVKFLKSKDYIILDFYKIPIKKQLEVISTGAEFIIPSSSAMYNLCFARLDAKITILDHDIEDNSGKLFGPLEMIGFNIIYVFFPSNESQSNNKHSNYIIDINKLENIL